MSFFKKITSFVLCLPIFLCSLSAGAVNIASESDISDIDKAIETSVSAAVIGETLEIGAVSAILMDAKSGTVLYDMNSDEPLPPASITKIMSLLLIMEAIDEGRLKLNDTVTASKHAASMGGSQIWLEENEVMTVDELLKAAVIASANDATVALAEKIAGSEEGFVAAMNEKAKMLGMDSTHFINATGLDADGHISSAHDVSLMSRALINHELIKNYSTVWMETLRGGETELVNTNRLVRFYEGTTGLKTGTTDSAGYCLSATAERDGLSLVAVIMHGNSSDERFEGAKKLLDFGFSNYSSVDINPILDKPSAPVKDGEEKTVPLYVQKKINLLTVKGAASDITQKTVLKKNITAPVKKGDVLGAVEIYSGEELLKTVDITAAKSVPRKSYFSVLKSLIRGLFIL